MRTGYFVCSQVITQSIWNQLTAKEKNKISQIVKIPVYLVPLLIQDSYKCLTWHCKWFFGREGASRSHTLAQTVLEQTRCSEAVSHTSKLSIHLINQLSHPPVQGHRRVDPIPSCTGREVRNTLNSSGVNHEANTCRQTTIHTYRQFRVFFASAHLHDWGRKQECLQETHTDLGRICKLHMIKAQMKGYMYNVAALVRSVL